MKKVLFMAINMNVGGTEKSLINLIHEMPSFEYEITVLLLEKSGGYLETLENFDNVTVKELNQYSGKRFLIHDSPKDIIKHYLKEKKIIKTFKILVSYIISKVFNNSYFYIRSVVNKFSPDLGNYDVAVAYAGPMDFISQYIISKVKANIKVQWIHFDVDKICFDKKFANKVYSKFNKVYVVSESAKTHLLKAVPEIRNFTEVKYNVVSAELCKSLADVGESFNDDFDGVRILTVGRLSKEKGQDIIPKVINELCKQNINFRWYLIGEGNLKDEIATEIKSMGLEQHLVFLGLRMNPYPYYKDCDIYVQPSIHEGYCLTLAEAKLFNKIIISTDFSGAREQFENYKNGTIVNNSVESFVDSIFKNIKKLGK
ncbi:glycosyltransferase [uncultured Eubacterium sp.]|uniref:glycosyltransferase n=1 Tax=uncultured Eubacterium sp. TaxID=165185 RepID=UPI0015AFDB1F|nr:glycosyltransferase [uncultured Eubacterium sp.]